MTQCYRRVTLRFEPLPRALDLARVGYLVVRNGRWKSEQFVSEAWLRASLTPVTSGVANYGGHRTDYGWLWSMFAIDATGSTAHRAETIYAWIGNLNQWLFVVPRYDLIVVVTGQSDASSPASFFFSDILPAVRATYLPRNWRCAQRERASSTRACSV